MKITRTPKAMLGLAMALALVYAIPASADRDLSRASPEAVGLSSEGLQKLTDEMNKAVDDANLAGIVTLVARKGQIAHYEHYGFQDLENQIPIQKDTIFRIFSMTKPVTGVALMMLYEEGKFGLDDPVEKYIPEFANLQVAKEDGPDGMPVTEPQNHKMTVRELMAHTGGLTYGLFSRSQVDTLYTRANVLDSNSTLKEMVDKLAQIPLRQQPGTLWHYSVSVDVQGYLVEVLSGQSFGDFLQQRIFDPLGMKDTGFHVPADKHHRFSREYTSGPNGLTSQPNRDFLEAPVFQGGGGGLTSTMDDYIRFAQMLANGGELSGVRILKPETVKVMSSNQLPEGMAEIPGYPGNQFGLDFAIVTDSERNAGMSVGSYWWWGIAGTWFWIDPVEDLVFVGMIQNRNLGYARQLQAQSKQLVYGAITESKR
jgi:CubicO group peptidase (beta-lactamase class C family)